MPRLVAFGCSYVYGHGLPDCHREGNQPGFTPSKFAWPNLLADKLGYECVNLSNPGSGNFEIFMKILNTEFLPDDLVIIAWSFFSRYDYHRIIDLNGNGIRLPSSNNDIDIVAQLLKINSNYIEKNYWDNWLIIQHCDLFLNSKNIASLSYLGFNRNNETKKDIIVPKLLCIKNLVEIRSLRKDYALDGAHPGVESHKLQAEIIYSKIIENELR